MHFSSLDAFAPGARSERHLSTLGLGAGATEGEIKRSYQSLVRQAHPDKGGDCERFRAVKEAYEALSGEVGGGDAGVHWMFEPRKTRDLRLELEVSEEELQAGCRKSIEVRRKVLAGTEQSSLFSKTTCLVCMGSGSISQIVRDRTTTHLFQEECDACDARGFFLPMREVSARVEVEVPAGAPDGHQVLVEGMADDERPFRSPGDVLVTCSIGRRKGQCPGEGGQSASN
ncbi:MAG: hypothetical protein EBV73_01630 [Rhodocyclales bacterium]|jgi:DnaJ-class molecular chaperone|nr:hypothetical protein [Rhodocyclales bacterium]